MSQFQWPYSATDRLFHNVMKGIHIAKPKYVTTAYMYFNSFYSCACNLFSSFPNQNCVLTELLKMKK